MAPVDGRPSPAHPARPAPLEHPAWKRALARVRAVGARELAAWPDRVASAGGDPELAQEVADHARAALAHLEAGRWDDACGAAEICLELEAEATGAASWREFSLLLEEAAETGRALL